MKKQFFLMIAAAAFFLTGCNSVDLSPLEKRIAELEGKVNAIEKSVSDLNSNASGLKTSVDALKQKLTVVSVEELSDGYKITFSDGKEAVIKDGAAGAAGAAGPQGPEGPQGPAGTAPTIGVSEVEGVLVWTVNGEAVKDKDGKVIPVSSTPKAPEFKYEKGVWYYRVGEGEWTACSEGEASAIEVIELDDVVLITIGDTVITLPKESVSAPIESIATVFKVKANRLFVPVGKTIDLKEWFTVAPEGALKTMVDYTFFKTTDTGQEIDLEGDELAAVPLAIDSKGVLTASGSGSYSLRISSKLDKTIKTNIVIRAGECTADEVPATSVTAQEKIQIYNGSIEEYNKQVNFGGTTSYNPANGAIAGIFNGQLNFRIGMPVTPNTNITMDNGHLYFKFYVSDASVFAAVESNFLEHTSSGKFDENEVDYDMRQLAPTLKSGWNEIDLPLKDFTYPGSDGKYDPTQASFIRFLCNANTNGKWIVYQMKDLFVYAAEPSVTAISHVLKVRSQLFVPVGKSVDLKDWFNVEPVGASKEGVTFTPEEGAGFTVSAEGILTATEACNKSVTITSKGDANVKLKLTVRTGNVPNDNLPAVSINPAQKIAIYTGSLEEYNSQVDAGGSTNYNPFNGAVAGVFQGASMNFRIGMPVTANSNITRANGRIHFMLYVSDPAAFSPAAFDANHFLEVTSSGTYDKDEANFDLTKFVPTLKSGWNEIDLPFSEAIGVENTFDVTKTNFLRFVCTTTNSDKFETFQIRDIFAYADATSVAVTAIETKIPKIFVPVGKTLDLTEWFTLTPSNATLADVNLTFTEGAPFTIADDGKLTATGTGSYNVNIISKADEEVKGVITVRTGPVSASADASAAPANAKYLFKDSYADYTALAGVGSSATWNPSDGAIAALVGEGAAGHNVYFKPNNVNSGVTISKGKLHFKWYISDISKLKNAAGQLEISSSGANDVNELAWTTNFISYCKSGWNDVTLDLHNASATGGVIDLTKINWIRFYNETFVVKNADGTIPYEISMIKDVYIYEAGSELPEGAYKFHSCDNTTHFTKDAGANRTVEIVTTGQKEGAGWYRSTMTKQAELLVIDPRGAFSLNASALTKDNGHLVFWFYCQEGPSDNTDRWATYADKYRARITGGWIRISSGKGTNGGIQWSTKDVLTNKYPIQPGWNKIDLKFSDAQVYGDGFVLDTSKIDFFQMYWEGPVASYDTYTLGFDNIYFYAEE